MFGVWRLVADARFRYSLPWSSKTQSCGLGSAGLGRAEPAEEVRMKRVWMVLAVGLAVVALATPAFTDDAAEGEAGVAAADEPGAAHEWTRRREWICSLRETAEGAYECASCADGADVPRAPVRGRCDYRWQRVPVYRTITVPVYDTREEPVYATRCVPRCREIEVPVYTVNRIPVTREVCDPCTGEIRTVTCGYRCEGVQTGTRMRRVIEGYDRERYQCGVRMVRFQTGTRTVQICCGCRCQCVPVDAPPPVSESPCRPAEWVTVTDAPDPSMVEILPGTTSVITETKYAKLADACEACHPPPP